MAQRPEVVLTTKDDGSIQAKCPWCSHTTSGKDKQKAANLMVGHFAGRHSDRYLIGNPYQIVDKT